MNGFGVILANTLVFVIYFVIRRWFFRINAGYIGVLLLVLPAAINPFMPVAPWYILISSVAGVFVLCADIKHTIERKNRSVG